jgi:putative oxidoreductase
MPFQVSLASVVLRAALAAVFIFHGLGKINEKTNYGTAWMPAMPMQEGVPVAMQAAVSWGELLGGAAMAIGFLPRVAAVGLIIIMGGAIATVHGANGFSLPKGWEYNYVLICVSLGVLLLGGGAYGVGRLFGSPFDKL